MIFLTYRDGVLMCTVVIRGSFSSSSPLVHRFCQSLSLCQRVAQRVLCDRQDRQIDVYNWSIKKITFLAVGSIIVISCLTLPRFMSLYPFNIVAGCVATAAVVYRLTSDYLSSTDGEPVLEQSAIPDSGAGAELAPSASIRDLQRSPALEEDVEKVSDAARLMELFISSWDPQLSDFSFSSSFDPQAFVDKLDAYFATFGPGSFYNPEQHFGRVEKFDLDPDENPHIYVRADLHGDLKSFIANLSRLQQLNLLTSDYRCDEGTHLVFLGDYCDRGVYGTEILELLIALKIENPNQVHLIRGNHENAAMNLTHSQSDTRLQTIVWHTDWKESLDRFYKTMPLSIYFSLQVEGKREYIQCAHGLFEVTTDPAPLLDNPAPYGYLHVCKHRSFSDRITAIADDDQSSMATAARRLQAIVPQVLSESLSDLTAYNWGDVSPGFSRIGDLGSRHYALGAADIRKYFDLSSTLHRVSLLIRGHQHRYSLLQDEDEGRVLVATLPVGIDSPYKNHPDFQGEPDCAYIMKPADTVDKWQKYLLLRFAGEEDTRLTDGVSLTSNAM